MDKQAIIALFPVKARLTKEILDNSDTIISTNCPGANTLKSVLPAELHKNICWLSVTGYIIMYGVGSDICITTSEAVEFISATEEQDVTFIIKKQPIHPDSFVLKP